MDCDVVICGYGPTGEVAANLLGQRGVRAVVVERGTEIFGIPRAVHFDGETMRLFQALGLEREVGEVSAPGESYTFLNARGRVLLHADIADLQPRHGWPVGNLFNQPLLEEVLRKGAERFPSVEVRQGWDLVGFEQDDDGVRVKIRRVDGDRGDEISARYLLGCDGAASTTRHLAGLRLTDLQCDQPWLVCDLMLDAGVEFRRTAFQFCDPRRPVTLVPCEGQHVRWEFMLHPGEDPAELEREDTVRELMAPYLRRLNRRLGPKDGTLLRRKTYRFHALVAETWRDGRLFLLGDAAHQTPPFLGQGMCAGIRDAFNLCWKLEGVLAGRLAPKVLETYQSERQPHARAVVEQAVRTGRIIQTTSRARALLRDVFFAASRILPALQRPFLGEPSWPLGPGLFDSPAPPSRSTAHGNPIDQPWVGTAAGERVRLDEVLGEGFAVLGLGVDPAQLVAAESSQSWAALGSRFLHVVPRGGVADGPGAVVDVDGGLAEWFARVGGRVAVLRPDRQVFGVYGRGRASDLRAELAEAAVCLAAWLPAG
jgi:3-(3-hydroxy-phenyl)propionate hydroxylase